MAELVDASYRLTAPARLVRVLDGAVGRRERRRWRVAPRPWHSQDRHVVRLEWGPTGAEALTRYAVASGAAVIAVVIDVLSFTTCVSVAADAGITVHPFRWKDDSAAAHAERLGATLAVPRSQSRGCSARGDPAIGRWRPISLSPRSIRDGIRGDRPRAALTERLDDQSAARRRGR